MGSETDRPATNFVGVSTHGEIELYEWLRGHTGVLAFCRTSFDPVSEDLLLAIGRSHGWFAVDDVRFLAVCSAPILQLMDWRNALTRAQSIDLSVPIVADPELAIAAAYGVDRWCTSPIVMLIDLQRRIRGEWCFPSESGGRLEHVASRAMMLRDATR